MIGGYDDRLNGIPIDPATGAPDPDGELLTPAHLGATLLTLGNQACYGPPCPGSIIE